MSISEIRDLKAIFQRFIEAGGKVGCTLSVRVPAPIKPGFYTTIVSEDEQLRRYRDSQIHVPIRSLDVQDFLNDFEACRRYKELDVATKQ